MRPKEEMQFEAMKEIVTCYLQLKQLEAEYKSGMIHEQQLESNREYVRGKLYMVYRMATGVIGTDMSELYDDKMIDALSEFAAHNIAALKELTLEQFQTYLNQ